MIDNRIKKAFREIIDDEEICFDCSLKNYSSFRIGGPADALIKVDSRKQLSLLLSVLKNEGIGFFVIGRGTNLLIDDNGFRGVVLKLGNEFREMAVEGNYISAGSALMMPQLVVRCAKKNLGGIEHLAVIPGTVGGGIVQNAGSSNQEIKSRLVSVEVMDGDKGIKTMMRDELRMSYRTSVFRDEAKGHIILSSKLALEPREFITVKNDIKKRIISRKEKLPLKYHNAGSIFKRPSNGVPPGKLIEEAGCKGLSMGDAEVSRKHANFIVNNSNATSDDILKLVDIVRQRVFMNSGITLELEIEVIKSDPCAV